MRKASAALVPVIAIDRRADRSLHRQISDAFRDAILRGELRSGQRIPSTRLLAEELGISRISVISAYEELTAEGYFETRAGSGTFVSHSLPEKLMLCEPDTARSTAARASQRTLSRRSERVPSLERPPWVLGKGAFSIGQPAFEQFPIRTWSRLVARHGRNLKTTSLQYGHPGGRLELRKALAAYLRSSRAVRCEAEQILIVSGSQAALHIAALALLDPGDRVWIEEPGYWLARRVFELADARIVPVPVDAEGIDVAAGTRLYRKAKLAFVTPSHQFPLGATMSLARRLQLLEWAQRNGSWIIEDDYDAEYRYESRPIASLQKLDTEQRVIYVGTFSKVLFPALRTGYMVVPLDLLDRFLAVRQTIDVSQADFHQTVLAQFIEEGHFARHIRRMRTLYGERRAVLAASLRRYFGNQLELHGAESGMHLTVTLPKGLRDRDLSIQAAKRRLWLWPLSSMYYGRALRQGWLLGFGSVTDKEIPRAVQLMEEIVNGNAPQTVRRGGS
mgnify:CR=1 FL=1|jgi:GntR family transcriptional regulator/MocR family aminotransferase